MKTIIVTLDIDGTELAIVEIPKKLDLATLKHYQWHTYATHLADGEKLDVALETIRQLYYIDRKKMED